MCARPHRVDVVTLAASVVLFAGSASTAFAQFGPGGTTVRLGVASNSGGSSSYPQAGNRLISVKGNVTAGNVRNYQCWYRNAAAFCTPQPFNLTNGVAVTWAP